MSLILGTQTTVNTYVNDDQLESAVAVLGDGGWVVTWQSYGQDGDDNGIYLQRYNSSGAKAGVETKVNGVTTIGSQSMPSIAAYSGGWTITWDSYGQNNDQYEGVYTKYYKDNNMFLAEGHYNAYTISDQKSSAMTQLADGGWIVTWQSDGQDGDQNGIYMSRFTSIPSKVFGELPVNTTTIGNQSNASVTGLVDGGWIVTWQSDGQDGEYNEIYQQRYASSGLAVKSGVETRVNTETAFDQTMPSVMALSGGGWVVIWQTYNDDKSEYTLYQQFYSSDGVAAPGSETRINTLSSGDTMGQTVAGLPNGGWVVIWGQDGNILQQLFDAAGTAIGGNATIGTNAVENGSPTVAVLPDGGWVVAWQSQNDNGDADIVQRVIHTSTAEAPTGADSVIGVLEGNTHVFTALDFGFSDGTQGDELQAVIITDLRGGGFFQLSHLDTVLGQDVTTVIKAGDTILAADINGLEWVPNENSVGNAVASISFKVVDTGGTAGSGLNTDETANTITFDIHHINVAPQGAGNLVTTRTDRPYQFKADEFGFSDTDGNDLAGMIIDTVPMMGSLKLAGVAVQAGQFVAAAQIASLVWTPPANGSGTAGFTFRLKDNGGTQNEGNDTDPTPDAMFIVYTPHTAPAGTDFTMTVKEDTKVHFTAEQFGFHDSDGDSLAGIVISTLPSSGTLTLKGQALSAQTMVELADLADLVWSPVKNSFGDDLASFTFQVVDNGSLDNGGATTDATSNLLTFDVVDVIDRFVGNSRGNKLVGTAGVDLLSGRKGNDSLTGGAGSDTFVFFAKNGRDVVNDFTATGSQHDVIDISGITAIKGFNDLFSNHMHQSRANVIIDHIGTGHSITLKNVDINDLDAGNFLF